MYDVDLTITLPTDGYQVLAEAAESSDNGDLTVRQCIELYLDRLVAIILDERAQDGESL